MRNYDMQSWESPSTTALSWSSKNGNKTERRSLVPPTRPCRLKRKKLWNDHDRHDPIYSWTWNMTITAIGQRGTTCKGWLPKMNAGNDSGHIGPVGKQRTMQMNVELGSFHAIHGSAHAASSPTKLHSLHHCDNLIPDSSFSYSHTCVPMSSVH